MTDAIDQDEPCDEPLSSWLDGDGRPILDPGQLYVDSNFSLRVNAWCSVAGVTLAIRTRQIRKIDGQIVNGADQLLTTSNRVVSSIDLQLAPGWPVNILVFALAGTPIIGQCFVQVQIVAGDGPAAIVLGTVMQAYITPTQPLAWPGAVVQNSLEGPGALVTVQGTNPGAGNQITETVPAGCRRQQQSFRYQLVTSAVVGNRQTCLVLDDGANEFQYSGGNFVQAASSTFRYSFGTGEPQMFSAPATNGINSPLPTPLYLGAGYRIKTQTAAFDVGDVYSLIVNTFREWLTAD